MTSSQDAADAAGTTAGGATEAVWPPHYSAEVVAPAFGGRLTGYVVALEAWRRGLKVTLRDGILREFLVEDESGRRIRFIRSRPHMTTAAAIRTVNHKFRTNQVLREAGLSVPQAVLLDTATMTMDQVLRHAREIGYPLVLKPVDGAMGTGVFTRITSDEQTEKYYRYLVDHYGCASVLMESHETGEDIRVLVIEDRAVAVTLRRPAHVVGDGVHTVGELIDRKNEVRRQNPFLAKGLITRDDEIADYIARAGLTEADVPAAGAHIQLRGSASGSNGGDTYDSTDEFPQAVKDEVARAVHVVPGLYAAGVDILYDPEAESAAQSYTIIEINGHAQIGMNMYPTHGTGVDVPRQWLDVCFPDSPRSRIPEEDTLTFEVADVLALLRTGAAESVVLAPVPARRLPVRRIVTVGLRRSLTALRRNRISSAARRLGVSGRAQVEDTTLTLHIAAEDESLFEEFLEAVRTQVRARPDTSEPWESVVRTGFRWAD